MLYIIDRVEEIVIANSQVFPSCSPYNMMGSHERQKEHAELVKKNACLEF